jgi:hypothetical protein
MKKYIPWAVLLLVLGAGGWGLYAAGQRSQADDLDKARKDAEAERLKAEEADVAAEATKKELEEKISESLILAADYEDLKARYGAKPKTVTKWRTRDVEVPVEVAVRQEPTVIREPYPVEVQVPCDIDPTDITARCPEVCAWRAAGEQMTVSTVEGNTVAKGAVEMWRTRPEPEVYLGRGAIQADLFEVEPVRPPRARPNTFSLDYGFDHSLWALGYERRLWRRLGLRIGYTWWDDYSGFRINCDQFDSGSVCSETGVGSITESTLTMGLSWSF